MNLKINRNQKIWIFTLTLHILLIFLFSNFGLKYKNPPDPKASVEIEIIAGEPESSNVTEEIIQDKDPEEINEEIVEEDYKSKGNEEKIEEEMDIEEVENKEIGTITQQTDKEKIEEQKKKEFQSKQNIIEDKLSNPKKEEDYEWSLEIESKKVDNTNWFHGKADGEEGTEFGVEGFDRTATIPRPKKKEIIESIDPNGKVLETSEFKIYINIRIDTKGTVKDAKIDKEKSTTGYKPHHKKRSEKAALKAEFSPVEKSKGTQKGYIIYTYKLHDQKE